MNELEKENTSVLKNIKIIFSKKQDEKEQLRGQSSSIRSRYEADEKSNADLLFEESLTKTSTPFAQKTGSNIAATEEGQKKVQFFGV